MRGPMPVPKLASTAPKMPAHARYPCIHACPMHHPCTHACSMQVSLAFRWSDMQLSLGAAVGSGVGGVQGQAVISLCPALYHALPRYASPCSALTRPTSPHPILPWPVLCTALYCEGAALAPACPAPPIPATPCHTLPHPAPTRPDPTRPALHCSALH